MQPRYQACSRSCVAWKFRWRPYHGVCMAAKAEAEANVCVPAKVEADVPVYVSAEAKLDAPAGVPAEAKLEAPAYVPEDDVSGGIVCVPAIQEAGVTSRGAAAADGAFAVKNCGNVKSPHMSRRLTKAAKSSWVPTSLAS